MTSPAPQKTMITISVTDFCLYSIVGRGISLPELCVYRDWSGDDTPTLAALRGLVWACGMDSDALELFTRAVRDSELEHEPDDSPYGLRAC